MRDPAAPTLTTSASGDGASRGWVACLRRGTRELWFAGGPGIGRIGYELANQDIADAAVALEMGKLLGTLDAQRRAELEKVVEAGRLRDRAQVISQDVEGSPGFSTVSICLDQHPMGHLVQQYEKGQVWFDEKVADSIEEARELARVLGGGDDTDLGNGLAL